MVEPCKKLDSEQDKLKPKLGTQGDSLASDGQQDHSGVESYSPDGKPYSEMSLEELFQEADRIGNKYQD